MALIFDRRAELGDAPGLHALVVGVSAYRHLAGGAEERPETFGMGQLTTTASSAHRVCRWLLERRDHLAVPLATCRLLLSPSPEEELEGDPGAGARTATLEHFLAEADAWRRDAATSADHVTFFYFAGHGIQRTKKDAVLLFEDSNAPGGHYLRKTTDVDSVFWGMSPSASHPDIARTQIYLIDACRTQLEELRGFEDLRPEATFPVELAGRDDRCAPVFYAAIPNAKARAIPLEQTLFSRALLACLGGAAAEPLAADGAGARWGVSVHSLSEALDKEIERLNRRYGGDQECVPGGQLKNAPLCWLDGPPQGRVAVEVDPAAAHRHCLLRVRDQEGRVVVERPPPLVPHPFLHPSAAGIYSLELSFDPPRPPYRDAMRLCDLTRAPFTFTWKARVE